MSFESGSEIWWALVLVSRLLGLLSDLLGSVGVQEALRNQMDDPGRLLVTVERRATSPHSYSYLATKWEKVSSQG
jgi:hypothetical protein